MTVGTLGFIGLGVMGEPMSRNLAAKSGRPVIAACAKAISATLRAKMPIVSSVGRMWRSPVRSIPSRPAL